LVSRELESYGSFRSEDAVSLPHTKTQRVSLVFLPLVSHSSLGLHQFPAINPEGRRLRFKVLLSVRRRPMGLHRGGMPEGGYCLITLRHFLSSLIVHGSKGSINNRINILYFLDSLCEASLLAKSHPSALGQGVQPDSSFYVDYVGRDLSKIVESVVPEGRIGLPNLMSTKQVCSLFPSFLPLSFPCSLAETRSWRIGVASAFSTRKKSMMP
jgi:CTD kinase subunit gamma CTK3